jgi:hypothetical protein
MRAPRPAVAVFAGLVVAGVLSLAPSHALAVQPPTATTEGASEVSSSAATLNGSVNPQGLEAGSDTRWCFQYGEGSIPGYNLGSIPVLAGDAGTGTTGVPVSIHVGGLEPGSAYRYRLVAVNSLGTGLGSTACGTEGGQETLGAEEILTTPVTLPAPQAETGHASSISQNTATITGTISPHGQPTSYEFQVGIDTSYGVQVFGQSGEGTEPVPVSLNLQYLQPGTTYHYRLLATSPAGTSYGADATLTTGVYPTSVILPPASTPLLATPTVTFPTTPTETTTTTPKTKTKTKPKAKKKAKKARSAKNARRASRTTTKTSRNGRGAKKGRRSA